jgi:hypothetical protein
MAGKMSTTEALDDDLVRKYIHGCHILHYHGIVDAYGHLSCRLSESVFMMCRYIAPALVSCKADILLYRVEDGEAIQKDAPKGSSAAALAYPSPRRPEP